MFGFNEQNFHEAQFLIIKATLLGEQIVKNTSNCTLTYQSELQVSKLSPPPPRDTNIFLLLKFQNYFTCDVYHKVQNISHVQAYFLLLVRSLSFKINCV